MDNVDDMGKHLNKMITPKGLRKKRNSSQSEKGHTE